MCEEEGREREREREKEREKTFQAFFCRINGQLGQNNLGEKKSESRYHYCFVLFCFIIRLYYVLFLSFLIISNYQEQNNLDHKDSLPYSISQH